MSSAYSFSLHSTPPRKPTAHHCNAERKHNPFRALSNTDLQPLAQNLFGNYNPHQPNSSNAVRSLR